MTGGPQGRVHPRWPVSEGHSRGRSLVGEPRVEQSLQLGHQLPMRPLKELAWSHLDTKLAVDVFRAPVAGRSTRLPDSACCGPKACQAHSQTTGRTQQVLVGPSLGEKCCRDSPGHSTPEAECEMPCTARGSWCLPEPGRLRRGPLRAARLCLLTRASVVLHPQPRREATDGPFVERRLSLKDIKKLKELENR